MGKFNFYRSGIYTSVDGYGIKEIGLEYKCARFNFRLYFFKVRFNSHGCCRQFASKQMKMMACGASNRI